MLNLVVKGFRIELKFLAKIIQEIEKEKPTMGAPYSSPAWISGKLWLESLLGANSS